jgi:hypothetical protein
LIVIRQDDEVGVKCIVKRHTPIADQVPDDSNGFAGACQCLGIYHPMLGFDLHFRGWTKSQDEASTGQVSDCGRGHGNRWHGADEDAADAGAKPDARCPHGAGGQDCELISAMTFGDPGRLIAKASCEDDKVNHISRV